MNNKVSLKKHLVLFLLLGCNTVAFSQLRTGISARKPALPTYSTPYVIPTVKDVKNIVDRIQQRVEKNSLFYLVDSINGQTISYSQPNKNAIYPQGAFYFIEWSYPNGVSLSACNDLYETTNDTTYFNYAIRFFDFTFKAMPYFRTMEENGLIRHHPYKKMIHMAALDHCGAIGAALIKIQKRYPDHRFREWIDTIADYIYNKQYRLRDRTIARQRPQPQSLWADDLYMCIPFLAQMGSLTGDKKYYEDAVRQVIQLSARLFDQQTGLYDHGWNVNSAADDPQFYWGRANGWCIMAMAELLSVLPENFEGRDKVLALYRRHAQALVHLQDGTGLWHNLLDQPRSYLETSASAIFVYSIAKGVNEGWLSHIYGSAALAGWNALATKVTESGEVCDIVEGTTLAHDNVYYFNRGKSCTTNFHGTVMRAGSEIIRLLNNPRFVIESPVPNSTIHVKLRADIQSK